MLTIVLAAAFALLLVGTLLIRPRLVWLVVQGILAAATQPLWALIRLPIKLCDFLTEATAAKKAAAHRDIAEVAAVLWATTTEYRPAARQILANICLGFGIRPNVSDGEPLRPKSYAEGRVAQVSSIVNAGNAAQTSGDKKA